MAFLCPVRIKRSKKKKPSRSSDDGMPGLLLAGSGSLAESGSSKANNPSGPVMGRITGSASIETLVRVGIEKENGLTPDAKMVVLHDFTPCVDDELEVNRGQVVHVLYQENDWVYVISEENRAEGFIPHSYCAQYGSQMATLALNVRKKLPRGEQGLVPTETTTTTTTTPSSAADTAAAATSVPGKATSMNGLPTTATMASVQFMQQQQQQDHTQNNNNNNNKGAAAFDSSQLPNAASSVIGEASSTQRDNNNSRPFLKSAAQGRYVVLYSYSAQDENDLCVQRGQCVSLLNSEDPDWYWVARYDGLEGFVPSGFIYPLDAIQRHQNLNPTATPVLHPPPQLPASVTTSTHPQGSTRNQQQQFPQQQPLPTRHSNFRSASTAGSSLQNLKQQQNVPYLPHNNSQLYQHQPQSMVSPLGSAGGGSSGPSSHSTVNGDRNPNVNGLPLAPAPAAIATSHNFLLQPLPQGSTSTTGSSGMQQQQQQEQQQQQYHGTELVMLYDYKAQAPDDLSVFRGDWVYADLSNQTVEGWLWSFAPKTGKYGFIPKAYARPPAMTSL